VEYFEARFNTPEIHLYVLADFHYGSPRCNEQLLNRLIKQIKEDRLASWIAIGDLTENNLEMSCGSTFEQILSPKEQLYGRRGEKEGIIEILSPIASKGLFMIEGNHGYRTTKYTDLSPDQIIADYLGVPFKGIGCLGKIFVKRTPFKLLAHHGSGGGRTMGGKINAALRVRDLAPTADLIISGHTHTLTRTPTVWFDLQSTRGTKPNCLYEGRGWDYVCGSLLEYGGGYAERKVMPPAIKGQMMIRLFYRGSGHVEKKQMYEVIE
jgi:predicted phosphodiesterase